MKRYDVYKNKFGTGYILDVQTDLLSGLNTRVVVPLMGVSDSPKLAKYLNPTFNVKGEEVAMMTQFIAAIPESELTNQTGNLGEFHHEISSALDMIFSGF
ncbi:CcdB family protein [Brumicola pallidula]|jgi:toxin CcdB|nr:CcdB family protein [Glaciecola pallidula]